MAGECAGVSTAEAPGHRGGGTTVVTGKEICWEVVWMVSR